MFKILINEFNTLSEKQLIILISSCPATKQIGHSPDYLGHIR